MSYLSCKVHSVLQIFVLVMYIICISYILHIYVLVVYIIYIGCIKI